MHAAIHTQTTSIGDLPLHYASAGRQGQPLLLFLHGFPEAWFAWEQQLREFGTTHFAVAPDLPGYNLSAAPAALRDYRAQAIVERLSSFVASLGYRELVLVGHDWGAAIAYTWAIARPDMVRRLCIVNGVHPWCFWRELAHSPRQARHSAYMNRLRLEPDVAERLARDGCAELCDFFRVDGTMPTWFDAATRARYIAAWTRPGALQGSINYYRASPLYPAIGDDPGVSKLQLDPADFQVIAPTLVLWGEKDEYLLPGCLDGLGTVVPDLRLHRFAQSSHWLAHEMPRELTRQLRAHLATS